MGVWVCRCVGVWVCGCVCVCVCAHVSVYLCFSVCMLGSWKSCSWFAMVLSEEPSAASFKSMPQDMLEMPSLA